jgi:predicted Zn-dependent protease with MMP-like domain
MAHKGTRVSRAVFEAAVDDALTLIPQELLDQLDNVAILVEDEPPSDDPHLLGLYEGTPLTERDGWGLELPDRITLFQGPLERFCADITDLREQIAVTVVHEVAHYFGIDDDRLHELGWD